VTLAELLIRAAREPIGVDISDYSDEFCAGFLAGQTHILEEIEAGRLLISEIVPPEGQS
jgi:hypothetical protein